MAGPASLGELGVNTVGEALAFAAGFAAHEALGPIAVAVSQKAWGVAPVRAVDPVVAAEIVAEDVADEPWGKDEAAAHGINEERFRKIIGEVLNAPGFAELVTMLRRGTITPAEFDHGLRKAKFEGRWDEPLRELEHVRLTPEVLAVMVQRGVVDNPGLLPVGPPSAVGKVPPMPQAALDVLREASAGGIDRERLAALARIIGLPASPDLAARMVFRAIIERVDFDRAISEGNTRNEWAPFLFDAFRQILTPHEFVEGRLRGWIDDEQMYAGTALHGMSREHTRLLFEESGRPIPVHQITTGLARGGEFDGDASAIPEAYVRSLQQGSQRPEWYSLSYANRFTYPSAFVLRALTQSGELTGDEAHDILLKIGWEPALAEKAARVWSAGRAAKGDPHVGKAETQMWTALHKAYIAEEIDDATLSEKLDVLGVAADAKPEVTHLWQEERELVRRELTPSQVKRAYSEGKLTRDEATGRLERLHMIPTDVALFLDE